jgi:DNA-binding CsgD family transcriptional regulator
MLVMTGELTTLGVGPDAERLYRRVLRGSPADLDTHGDALGWGRANAYAAYQELLSAGLVAQTAAGLVTAESPNVAIGRLIAQESARLDSRRRELDDVASVIANFTDEHRGRAAPGDVVALEVVPAPLVSSVVDDVIRTTSGLIRTWATSAASVPGQEDALIRQLQEQLARGREMQTIYPVTITRTPGARGLLLLRSWADVGQQQRLMEEVPHEFTVFGDELVLAGAEWGAHTDDLVVIRSPLLVRMFTAMFDQAWRSALPMPESAAQLDTDERLLTLLASGLKDEAIARYLGVSLRTVRRRVAVLMELLGAQTRFQLGSAAERRGLLDPERTKGPSGGAEGALRGR